MTKILILATPRTGSNALCEAMTNIKQFGHVDGFFVGHGQDLDNVFEDRCEAWDKTHASPNGVMATKVMWDYLDEIAHYTSIDRLMAWLLSFDHYVHLYREDTAAQAVSWFMALGTGKWTSYNDRKRPDPDYNRAKIRYFEGRIVGYDTRTQLFTEGNALKIEYESDILPNVSLGVQKLYNEILYPQTGRITDFVSRELVAKHQRQVDSVKDLYVEQYREEAYATNSA